MPMVLGFVRCVAVIDRDESHSKTAGCCSDQRVSTVFERPTPVLLALLEASCTQVFCATSGQHKAHSGQQQGEHTEQFPIERGDRYHCGASGRHR